MDHKNKLCRHCHKNKVSRPRGLCWTCYEYRPGVRDLYAASDSFGSERRASSYTVSATDPEPTDTLPGSPERVKVYEDRAQRGQKIFHPEDRGFDE